MAEITPSSQPISTRRIAAVVLLREDGAALLQHRDNKPGLPSAGLWVMPGGHCETDESLEACACREFLEETAYTCQGLHWLLTIEGHQDQGRPPSDLTFFWARYDGVQPVTCLEGQALEFIEREQAPNYPIEAYQVEIWDRAIAAANLIPLSTQKTTSDL
ncbi:MAG: NUDIX hydrolase [Leptolyngbyaceae cyanobacterium bins.59]|nr:NUDIX hydrolase [Leptolyngbyaceae cyanobacterium bins.59]